MSWDWSTIRLCNTCGKAVDGKATVCKDCQHSDLGPAAPGTLTTGGNDFGGAARDVRHLGPSYVVLAIPWAMLAVVTAVTFLLPAEEVLKLDNVQTLGARLNWLGDIGCLLIILGGAWQSYMLFRLAERVSIKEWRESVEMSANVLAGMVTPVGVLCLFVRLLEVADIVIVVPPGPTVYGLVVCGCIYARSQYMLVRGCDGAGRIFSNDSLRAHAQQVMREWIASGACLALLTAFPTMMREERAGQFVIIRILALPLMTLITYTVLNTMFVLRRTARAFEDVTMGRVASGAASLTSNAPAP